MGLDPQVSPVEIKSREVKPLDPQVSPKEIMSREVELGCESWTSFAFESFLNSSATDIVLVTLPSTAAETATAQCTDRRAMARGHGLNTSIVLAAVHGFSGFLGAVSAVEPSLSRPLPPNTSPPPSPVPNKQPRFCGRKAKRSQDGHLDFHTALISDSDLERGNLSLLWVIPGVKFSLCVHPAPLQRMVCGSC